MPLSGDEHVCPKFQPNIFNSSRCHECLRLKHLHMDMSTKPTEQEHALAEISGKEKEPSNTEDCDGMSVLSGGSLCIVSPECDLYVWNGDEDESFTSDSQWRSISTSEEEEEEEDFFTFPCSRMTRLDPSSHRMNPRAWMEEAQSRGNFGRRSSVPHVSSKGDRNRDGRFVSMGRAIGSLTSRDKSPPAPHRHAERGHPVPSNRTPEPKAVIPFRNPDLGVPSQRRTSEIHNSDWAGTAPSSPSPEPVDLSIEVEAQVGPRSLSPTPFKQAESLATSRKRGVKTSHSPSSPKSEHFYSSKQDSAFSRSSPSSRSHSPSKRAESGFSLQSHGFGACPVSERSANRTSYGRSSEPEIIRKNFQSFASAVGTASKVTKSLANPYAELRAGLRKAEPKGERSTKTRSPSPTRRSHEPAGQSFRGKRETKSSSNTPKRSESRCSSPSRTSRQSLMRKVVEGLRSASPVRKGYGTSQSEKSFTANVRTRNSTISSPSRRSSEAGGRLLPKTEAKRNSSPLRRSYNASSQLAPKAGSNRCTSSRSPSPFKHDDSFGQTHFRKSGGKSAREQPASYSRTDAASCKGKSANSNTAGSWRGSTHSLNSPPLSRNYSTFSKCRENKTTGTRKSAHVSWSGSEREKGRDCHSPSHRNRSPSPHMRTHTSSQSSIDSFMSSGSSGLNREENVDVVDLPNVKSSSSVLQRAAPNKLEETERGGNRDETSLYKPASHTHTKHAHITWDDMMEQRETPSISFTPPHTQDSRARQEDKPVQRPDLLNFKKGWMSKQDQTGEWKKHWFVLTDAGLRYYRDSGAEEKDELDGEIDLRSCVKVSEFEVEKNYGFQIQTVSGVYTLSAMTAGIRRNWIEVLRKNIRPSSSPDLTQLTDSTTESLHLSSHRLRSQSETSPAPSPAPTVATTHKLDCVELSPIATPPPPGPTSQREAGEGEVREHDRAQDEKSRNVRREATSSRKWPARAGDQKRLEEEIEKKWEEFERLPQKMTTSLPALGTWAGNEALQREQVAPLRQRSECVRGGVGVCVGVCVSEGGVCVCLEEMELAHKCALEELQRNHERQTEEQQRERERELREEVEATARAMEALRKAYEAELEQELQKSKTLTRKPSDTLSLRDQHQKELVYLRRELDGLSDRYSQKCLELNREQQNNGEKERQISLKEREMEQLRRNNQDLQARLAEDIQSVCPPVTGQQPRNAATTTTGNKERKASELEVLLRVKQNELEYLHKQITCLQNEVHFLNTEKQGVCSRYKDVCEELKVIKEQSEQEAHTLREHLRLAVTALQEEQGLHNSI